MIRRGVRGTVPLDPGVVHRFTMLQRAVRTQAKSGRFDESLPLLEEMFSLEPADAGLSKLKARFAADLIKRATQRQKIEAAAKIVELVDRRVSPEHLGDQERDLLARAKADLFSL